MTDYKLTDVIDSEKLIMILNKFTEATDLAAILCDLTGKNITGPSNFTRHCSMVRSTELGKIKCYESDAKHGITSVEEGTPIMLPCHCGLIDLAAPIVVEGRCFGYVLCGQVFLTPPKNKDIEHAKIRAKQFGLDVDEYVQSFLEVKVLTKDRLIAAAEVVNIFSNYLVELGLNRLMQQRLMEEERRRLKLENLLRVAELKALQAQLNPHFLFNTLNTAARFSYLENAHKTGDIIYSLANLLRFSLRNPQQFVTLDEEITYIKHYLYIQKIRYQEQLETAIDVPEDLKTILLPVMTLQPLVENAIIHGLERKEDNWKLSIKAFTKENVVIIEISDNGVGMDSNALKELNNFAKTGKGHTTGIGIPNVDIRLKQYFGVEYGLEIASKPGFGTNVMIKVPKTYQAKGVAGSEV